MKTNKLLATVVVLQGLILIGQWTGGGNYLPSASAQVPARWLQGETCLRPSPCRRAAG